MPKGVKISKTAKKITAIVLLLALWQAAAMIMNQDLLLASPTDVLMRLFMLMGEEEFLETIGFSFLRISLGFFAGLILGLLFSLLAYTHEWIEIILSPIMTAIKTVPVASFVILALIFIPSGRLNYFISFLMVLPVIYNNVLSGFKAIDLKMNEMADCYRLSWGRRFHYIWVPSIFPYLISACEISLGLAWKSGVAAEVIGIPTGSIGEQLYMSKVYLDSAGLLAWTVIIVLISVLFGKAVIRVLKFIYGKYCS